MPPEEQTQQVAPTPVADDLDLQMARPGDFDWNVAKPAEDKPKEEGATAAKPPEPPVSAETPAVAPATAPAVPPPPAAPQPPDWVAALAQQNMQTQQQLQMMAQLQAQAAAAQMPRPEPPPPPDKDLEPERYMEWMIEQKTAVLKDQYLRDRQQMLANAIPGARDAVARNQPDADVLNPIVDHIINQNYQQGKVSAEQLADPGTWEIAYDMARGWAVKQNMRMQGKQQQAAPAAAPAASSRPEPPAQGRWPEAGAPAPAVAPVGGAPPPKSKTTLTTEQRIVARKAGLTDDEYAKYL